MCGLRRMAGTELAIAATFVAALAGCGTSMNSASSSSQGTMQAQSQPAVGPVLGYVWDSAGQALRPVQGLPGASIVGTAVVSAPQGAAFIASASSGVSGTALFLDANGGVFQSSLAGGKLTKVANLPGANGLVLSNSGAYALVTGKSVFGHKLCLGHRRPSASPFGSFPECFDGDFDIWRRSQRYRDRRSCHWLRPKWRRDCCFYRASRWHSGGCA